MNLKRNDDPDANVFTPAEVGWLLAVLEEEAQQAKHEGYKTTAKLAVRVAGKLQKVFKREAMKALERRQRHARG